MLFISYILSGLYFGTAFLGFFTNRAKKEAGSLFIEISLYLLMVMVASLGIMIVLRWVRLGHAPYIGQFEGLLSGLWISSLIYTHLIFANRRLRNTGIVGGFFIFLWFSWLMLLNRSDTILPAAYRTWWLVLHVFSGKVSYGLLFPVFVISISYIFNKGEDAMERRAMETLVYRYMALAFTFATAMMIGGGIWAQKVWGREWMWGSLEIWSLVLWLVYGLYIHLRITYNNVIKRFWSLYGILAYALTFYNLFGIPFLSRTIHKGVL